MKIVKQIFSILLIIIIGKTGLAQLTGVWQDDNGGCYKIRQTDNRIYWGMDASPRAVNVFTGYLAGNTITGTWIDIPGGNTMGSGTLSLRVESNVRMVKIDQTGNYGANIWTRVDRCGSSDCQSPVMRSSPGNNDILNINSYRVSPKGTHYMIMQDDGNLVIYEGGGPDNKGRATWHSVTYREQGEYFLAMQDDGNLVIYKGRYPENLHASFHIWSSKTSTDTGSYFVSITDDGKLQICTGSGPNDNPRVIGPK
jgi:hypothetical protein